MGPWRRPKFSPKDPKTISAAGEQRIEARVVGLAREGGLTGVERLESQGECLQIEEWRVDSGTASTVAAAAAAA